MQYLEADVRCPTNYMPGENEVEMLEWLLHLAIAYQHEDIIHPSSTPGIV